MATNETLPRTMQLMYPIDEYRRPGRMPPAEAPIDANFRAEGLYHTDDSVMTYAEIYNP